MIATWGDLWNTCGVLAAIGTTLIPSPSPLGWRVSSTKYVLQDPYIYCNKICPFPGTTGQVGQKPAVLVYGNVVLGWLWLRSLINDCQQPPRFSINTSMFANRIFPAKARVFCSNQFGANQQPMSAPEELRAVWSCSSRCGARVSFSGGDLQP